MPTSATEICNLAIDLLSGGIINDVGTPTTPDEEFLSRWYNKSRRKVLREHPWNFASKRTSLAASSTTPTFEWAYAYPLPADFIRLLSVHDSDGNITPTEEYEVESGSILTDAPSPLYIRYVYDYTNVLGMDELFVDQLVYEIALGIARKMSNSNTDIQVIEALLKQRSSMAKAIDGQEKPPVRVERSNSRNARNWGKRTDRIR